MATSAQPGDKGPDRTGNENDIERSGQSVGPADPDVLAQAADEDVLQSGDFPGGGSAGVAERGGPLHDDVTVSGGGSTGRGATDSGRTDSEGTPGGGMAGAAGG